jgi:hypothetical protein
MRQAAVDKPTSNAPHKQAPLKKNSLKTNPLAVKKILKNFFCPHYFFLKSQENS